jgi:hypothetical protein
MASLVHAVGHVVGGRHGLQHGVVHALLLPPAMRRLLPRAGAEDARRAAAALGAEGAGPDAGAAAAAAADEVRALVAGMPLPQRLRDVGVAEDALDVLAAAALGDRMIAYAPERLTEPDVRAVLRAAWRRPGDADGRAAARPRAASEGRDAPGELAARHGADDGVDHCAVAEEEERRDRLHAVALGQRRLLVHVDLGDRDPPRLLAPDLLESRGDGPARAAPRRPEVHDQARGGGDDLGEVARGEGKRRGLRPGVTHPADPSWWPRATGSRRRRAAPSRADYDAATRRRDSGRPGGPAIIARVEPAAPSSAPGGGRLRVGVDTGGTFTDIVGLDADGRVRTRKVPSSPDDYARAIGEGLQHLLRGAGLPASAAGEVVHGTTVASNAVLEGRGARTGLITTRGFRDVLEIRRLRMPRLYDLTWEKPPPLVERYLRLEVRERVSGRGEVVEPLAPDDVETVVERLVGEGVEALAVCLLNADANPVHERLIERIVRRRAPDRPLTLSADVLPEVGEYERTSTTVVNAYILPVVGRYLARLRAALADVGVWGPLLVMQSSGGLMGDEAARRSPVHVIESGPAAGVIGAQALARRLGLRRPARSTRGRATPPRCGVPRAGRPPQDWIDDDGIDVGRPIRLFVTLRKAGDRLVADWTGTAAQVKGAINNTLSFTKAATYTCLKAVLPPDIPSNAGFYRPVEVIAPPGTIAHAVPPAATAARALAGFRMVDCLLGALAQMLPDRVPAAAEGGTPASRSAATGRTGRRSSTSSSSVAPGAGARGRTAWTATPTSSGTSPSSPPSWPSSGARSKCGRWSSSPTRGAPAGTEGAWVSGGRTGSSRRREPSRCDPTGAPSGPTGSTAAGPAGPR